MIRPRPVHSDEQPAHSRVVIRTTQQAGSPRLVAVWAACALACLALAGCDAAPRVPPIDPSEALPGGETSIAYRPLPSFERPAKNLPREARPEFHAGKALANQPWVTAPTATDARDGLGPIYNARSCLACHANGGRGKIPEDGETALFSTLVRLSVPGRDEVVGVVPEPTYGDQVQTQSVALSHQLRGYVAANESDAQPEAQLYIDWQLETFSYPDGLEVELRRPELRFEELAYGPLREDVMTSVRVAPVIAGVGLLEAIPQAAIDALADPDDRDGDGISGRVNRVWDFDEKKTVPGRFGLKANRPNVRIVTAAAFAGDIGISNPLFPDPPCTAVQAKCLAGPHGNDEEGVELPGHLLDLVVDFVRDLGVAKQREAKNEAVARGRSHFFESGCPACHTPNHRTGESDTAPHLANQTIWPYSDLLLHDMGPGLADGRPDYEASGSEWRTAPLWGVGLAARVSGQQNLLHDGRARTVEEAILWHGGEAAAARTAFVELPDSARRDLIRFVESL